MTCKYLSSYSELRNGSIRLFMTSEVLIAGNDAIGVQKDLGGNEMETNRPPLSLSMDSVLPNLQLNARNLF